MSQLNQAKREAKRLLALSQKSNSPFQIKTLSEARKYIAALKGYHNWYDYQENLKRQDFLKGTIPQESSPPADIEATDYFLQEQEFIIHLKDTTAPLISVVEHVPHIPSVLGETPLKGSKKPTKGLLDNFSLGASRKSSNPADKWLLNSYPCTLVGTAGSGKTEVLRSQAAQWLANGEGLIYLEAKGLSTTYNYFYTIASSLKREQDVFCVNFLLPSAKPDRKITHSVDLLNNLVGNEKLIQILFGEEIGKVIHTISLYTQAKGILLDSQSIKAMLMIPNLVHWSKNQTFGIETTKSITEYIEKLGLILENHNLTSEAVVKHANFCKTAKLVVETFKQYEDAGVLSKTPEVDLRDVFLNRKILIISYPSLAKSWDTMSVLANSIMSTIWKVARDIERDMNFKPCFLQNLISDEANYAVSNKVADTICKNMPKNTNFIFSSQSFSSSSTSHFMEYALAVSKTVVIMKQEDNLPLILKGRIVEQAGYNSHVLYGNCLDIKELRAGTAFVYIEDAPYYTGNSPFPYRLPSNPVPELRYKDFKNNNKGSYFEKIVLTYIEQPNNSSGFLKDYEPTTKINKSLVLSEAMNHV